MTMRFAVAMPMVAVLAAFAYLGTHGRMPSKGSARETKARSAPAAADEAQFDDVDQDRDSDQRGDRNRDRRRARESDPDTDDPQDEEGMAAVDGRLGRMRDQMDTDGLGAFGAGLERDFDELEGLTNEEAVQRLRGLVGKMDENRDGLVSRGELTRFMDRAYRAAIIVEAETMLAGRLDTNGDGRLSWAEHEADLFFGNRRGGDQNATDGTDGAAAEAEDRLTRMRLRDEDRQFWKAADRDGDGVLNAEEFAAFYVPEEFDRMIPLLHGQVRLVDGDGDGRITLAEFLAAMGVGADGSGKTDEAARTKWTDKFQRKLDRNKDGILDHKEFIAWVVPDKFEMLRRQAKKIAKRVDKDDDGKLSVEEIGRNLKKFFGGKASRRSLSFTLKKRVYDEL